VSESSDYEIVIVGAGVAGLTAAAFAARLGRSTLLIERFAPGGHLMNVESIEDFPGFPNGVAGYELVPLLQEQASNAGAQFQMLEVESIERADPLWAVKTSEGIFRGKTLIVATGSHPKDLDVPGESRLQGHGISNCASCDGPLYSEQPVGVVGSGDYMLQEALTLAKYAGRVIVFHTEAAPSQQTFWRRVIDESKIEVRHNTTVDEVVGEDAVTGVIGHNKTTGEKSPVELAGLFVYAGLKPNTEFLKNLLHLDDDGRVPTDGSMRTELPGLFAVGDIRTDSAGLAITASADGAAAALAAHRYLIAAGWR
jgi:thioredoxin reductase (NADPH)